MSLMKFLASKSFRMNIAFAIILGICLIFLLNFYLSFFTRHGKALKVPDFTGLNIKEANKVAKNNKLKIEIIDSTYSNLINRGCVVEQLPNSGQKVKKNRRVVVIINAFLPEMVVMPNLVGLSARQAYSLISSAGLIAGFPVYKPDLAVDFVLEQMIKQTSVASGDSIKKGSEITLILGQGLSEVGIDLPSLKDKNFETAKKIILNSSLTIEKYTFDSSVKTKADSTEAIVYKQIPSPSEYSKIQLGSSISIWLSVDKELIRKIKTGVPHQLIDSLQIESDSL